MSLTDKTKWQRPPGQYWVIYLFRKVMANSVYVRSYSVKKIYINLKKKEIKYEYHKIRESNYLETSWTGTY